MESPERHACSDVAQLASVSTPSEDHSTNLQEVERTSSAASGSDIVLQEDIWWTSLGKTSTTSSLSRSSSSRRSDDWNFTDFDLSKTKLPMDESWWAPLAADTVRLAEDLAQGGCPIPSSWRISNFEPRKIWRRFRRYRYFLLFVTAVTVINGLFSILLLECLLGTSKVCMFGSCQSPHYTPGSSFAYDRSNLNLTSAPPTTENPPTVTNALPEYTDADDEAFLNEVSLEWDVSPHPSVPRAYTLRKKQGHYRALLVQDICYLFMQGTGPEHGRPTGVWFDADALDSVRMADVKGILDARDLQKLDLIDLLVQSVEEGEGDVHNGAFRYTPDFFKAQKRINRTVGSFVGPRGLAEYIQFSSTTAARQLKRSNMANPSLVGLVGGVESNIASFSSNSVFLSEIVGPSAALLKTSVVFFPGDRKVWSDWTLGALKASVGSDSSAMAGQKQGQPFCFRNVLFFLNERPAATVEIDNFRQKAWSIADSAVTFFRRNNQILASGSIQQVVETADIEVKVQLGYSADTARTVQLFKQVSLDPSRFQVTFLVDSAKDGTVSSSKIANLQELLSLVKKMFPKMEVMPFSLAEASFVEQAAIFKRTSLLIAPYGLVAGSTILLPRGATIVELFPFMFRSEATISTARAAGVNYFKWENEDMKNSHYDDDCLSKNSFHQLTVTECRRHRPCLFCVRDHVSTVVDRNEVKIVLSKAQQLVRTLLEASR